MKNRQPPIHKIRDKSGYFSKIIKVGVPTFFYFDKDGEFEGIEVGGMPACADTITPYSKQLVREVLRAVNGEDYMPKCRVKKRTPIPDVYKRALDEDGGQ